ncbi:MAG: hypothetical protein F9K49_06210, partial [Caedimonadaceae bacterium]
MESGERFKLSYSRPWRFSRSTGQFSRGLFCSCSLANLAPLMKKLTTGWLKLPGLQRLFTLFHEEGATLRLVGGSVRDGLLGLPTNDIDLAVDRPPQWVQD